MVFNYTLFYFNEDDDKLYINKFIRYLQILSPILLVILILLLKNEYISVINRSVTLSIYPSLLNLIGLVICAGNGSGLALNLIFNNSLPPILKIWWVFVGGICGGLVYLVIVQFL